MTFLYLYPQERIFYLKIPRWPPFDAVVDRLQWTSLYNHKTNVSYVHPPIFHKAHTNLVHRTTYHAHALTTVVSMKPVSMNGTHDTTRVHVVSAKAKVQKRKET